MNNFAKIIAKAADFPALKKTHNGFPVAYLDGPGGTQVPRQVIDAIVYYYENCNANHDGYFSTSIESDQIIQNARERMAVFLGSESADTISFGANMTTLAYSLSSAFARAFQPGDEVLITQLDHEANRGPWLKLREYGLEVLEVRINSDGTLDYDDFQSKLSERTRLVAMGMASNALGTVNDIKRVREWTYNTETHLLVDAVHYAPHFPIDVSALGVDFLLCSAYKFYGPHVGVLYTKPNLLDRFQTDSLRTQIQHAPHKIETGTLNHAALAGVKAAVEYIASIGEGKSLRAQLVSAMEQISRYEHVLAKQLYDSIRKFNKIKIYGPDMGSDLRTPTVSFTFEGMTAAELCKKLDEKGICAWDGHFYAIRPVEVLGLLEKGGLTRIGFSLYNRQEEIERVLGVLNELDKNN
jgi:cysteine desulfurase family protein (TIGR01976 family)